jgi:F0F1-type ATP synthase membrane subunit b/b'
MATLNLIPNPPVLAVQAGIFLLNIVVVKKLMLEPYLKIRDRRDQLTVGSKDSAEKATREADTATAEIHTRLTGAATEAKAEREKLREVALERKATIVTKAEAEARATVAAAETEIKQAMAQEKTKVPAIVKQLTDEVYRLALA